MTHNLIIWYDILDSTNKKAIEEFDRLDNLSVIAAFCQTDGRGQQGNRWDSEEGQNLLFSILLKDFRCFSPDGLPIKESFRLSRAAAVSVVRYLGKFSIQAQIKWPNDIYVGDKKIAGILIENAVSGTKLSRSVIGIGLNMGQTVFSPLLPNPVSVAQLTGLTFDKESLKTELEELHGIFCAMIESATLREEYEGLLYRKEGYFPFIERTSGEKIRGQICACEDDGRLILLKENGEIGKYYFKEVEFVI